MADIAGLEPASCGFESRSPHHYQSSDSSTDRMLGYEPGDVGSIPPLTTISQASAHAYTFALLHRSSAPLCTFALTDRPMSPCPRAP